MDPNLTCRRNRVAIAECKEIGFDDAFSLFSSSSVDELVLLGEGNDRLCDELSDLYRHFRVANPAAVYTGDYFAAAGADIAIIAATTDPISGETKLELLFRRIAEKVRKTVRKLISAGFDGILLVTTNPADLMARVALEESGFPPQRVIGMGAESGSVDLSVVAEKSDGVTWCSGRTSNVAFMDYCKPECPFFEKVLHKVHLNSGDRVGRGSERGGNVAVCVTNICEAILNDDRVMLPTFGLTSGEYGLSDVYISLTCIVGRCGVERIVEFPKSDSERLSLKARAEWLSHTYEELRQPLNRPAAQVILSKRRGEYEKSR
jgi:L-lactate dehydrogenase